MARKLIMQGNANITKSLEWNQYELVLSKLTEAIQLSSDLVQKKYAMYQTGIACGGYLGPTTKELLSIKWSDITGVGAYTFRYEPWRSPIVIENDFRKIIKNNYEILCPYSDRDFVIKSAFGSSNQPTWGRVFNKVFERILEEFEIYVPSPSIQTLRKTFARKIWQELGKDDQAIMELSRELGYSAKNIPGYIKI